MDLSGYSRSLLAAALLAIAVAPSLDAQTPLPGQRAVTRTKTLATPAGPAPFDVRVTPQSPIEHTFQWALVPDVAGFIVDVGWGTYGFKAGPVAGRRVAELIETGRTPDILRPFSIERFATGSLIGERAAAAVSH